MVIHGDAHGPHCDWFVDGQAVAGGGGVLSREFFTKGAEVRAQCESGGELASVSTIIGNIPPRIIEASLRPLNILQGTDAEVSPRVSDPDNDESEITFKYRWSLNGEHLVGHDSPVLPGELIHKGDAISLAITPRDPDGSGPVFQIADVIVANSSPRFVSHPGSNFFGDVFVYEASGEDPDGDALRYSLEQGPEGMGIDVATGRLTWKIGSTDAGEYPITIVAEDEEGLRDTQIFTLDLSVVR